MGRSAKIRHRRRRRSVRSRERFMRELYVTLWDILDDPLDDEHPTLPLWLKVREMRPDERSHS